MSMYGTYWGFSLPLSVLAALVARRPSVWSLASITYHLRSISLPLGTKVDISLLPSGNLQNKNRSAKRLGPCITPGPLPPTTKQICSGEDCGSWPPAEALAQLDWRMKTRAKTYIQQRVACSSRPPSGGQPAGPGEEITPSTKTSRWGAPIDTQTQAQHRARSSEYPKRPLESTKRAM